MAALRPLLLALLLCPSLGTGSAAPAFRNQGTPPNISRSYDCSVREHAWAFAKATLPRRGSFRTAFDALQLEACGLTRPAEEDAYAPPRFPTPTDGALLFVDPHAAAAGADGSKSRPFASLEAALAQAAAGGGDGRRRTLLLRRGVYRPRATLRLTAAHSDLTIQNYEGEEVTVSGAVPVTARKDAWSLVDRDTNLWRLDVKGQQLSPSFGMRVGPRRAILAKFPNGDPETAAAFCDSGNIPYGPGRYVNGSGRSMQIPTYFPRQHRSANTTVEYWARPQDWPGVVWHDYPASGPKAPPMQGAGGYGKGRRPLVSGLLPSNSGLLCTGAWFHAQGGLCSGRQVDHGYWCSASAPRSGNGLLQPPYNPPGGFLFRSNDSLPQAGGYRNASGAVFHARGGTNP